MSRNLDDCVTAIESIANPSWAEPWDRVGLQVEGRRRDRIGSILLCIDLTAAVAAEALQRDAALVIAYHPPIFKPLERLRRSRPGRPGAGALLALIEGGVSVYSPHTALDAAPGGVNDWLAAGLGPGSVRPLQPAAGGGQSLKVVVFVPESAEATLAEALAAAGAGRIGNYSECRFSAAGEGGFRGLEGANPRVGRRGVLEHVPERRLEMILPREALPAVQAAIRRAHPYEEPAFDFFERVVPASETVGQGRIVELEEAVGVDRLVERIKKHLGLDRLRLARPLGAGRRAPIRSAALCAGAGGSVLVGREADLYLTGEMRHHDVLRAVEEGRHVILCEHSSSERGYLRVLARRLKALLGSSVRVERARADREPLSIE